MPEAQPPADPRMKGFCDALAEAIASQLLASDARSESVLQEAGKTDPWVLFDRAGDPK